MAHMFNEEEIGGK